MEEEDNFVPENVLTAELLNYLPGAFQEKLQCWHKKICEEYFKEKAAAACIQQYNERQLELESLKADLDLKLQNATASINELRTQLDGVSQERTNLLEALNQHERELGATRAERNEVKEERDMLLRRYERQKQELERLRLEFETRDEQLKNAITTKCEAIARLGDIESKEATLEHKEKRMEQERLMLNNQIQSLSENLNRTMNDLQTVRSQTRMEMMQIDTQLKNKIQEVRTLESECERLREENVELKDDLQKQNDEFKTKSEQYVEYINHLKVELNAKSKLADLHKGEVADMQEKTQEIMNAVDEHRRMLKEAEKMHGDMETKMKAMTMKFEMELEAKQNELNEVRAELKSSKELIKAAQLDAVDSAIAEISPSAAVASRLMRADLSITEVYTMYVKATEELEQHKRENKRLELQMKSVLEEFQEQAPLLTKTSVEYARIREELNVVAHNRDELLAKCAEYDRELSDAVAEKKKLERLVTKLRQEHKDRDRQICYLLVEQTKLRRNISTSTRDTSVAAASAGDANMNDSTSTDPNDIITQRLVVYRDVEELQVNNMKLLACVRDLSTKLDEALKRETQEGWYKEKCENLLKKFERLQETLNQQNATVSTLLAKCERYKKLYFDAQKKLNNSQHSSGGIDDSEDDYDDDHRNEDNNESNDDGGKFMNGARGGKRRRKNSDDTNSSDPEAVKRIRELEQEVIIAKEKYKSLEERYEFYAKEKSVNEKLLSEQCDSLRTELRQISSENCQLATSVEYSKGQIKLHVKNIAAYKAQIAALEERARNYEQTIIKHEQTLDYLKDETLKAKSLQSMVESELHQLRQENHILKDTVTRLQVEKEGLHNMGFNQNLLLQSLELIKTNFERSESEGRQRLEKRLDEALRDLSAQRLHHQEEQTRFHQLTKELQAETENAKRRAKEEEQQASELRQQLIALREELTQKVNKIDELSKKLQESLAPSSNDNPIMQLTKKARDLELKLADRQVMIESLSKERDDARAHVEQYSKMTQNAEREIRNLYESHTAEKTKLEAEVNKLTQANADMKSKIAELEAEVQLVNIPENSGGDSNTTVELDKTKTELKSMLQKIADYERNHRSLRAENTSLAGDLHALELKYANEMRLHSSDIQELTRIKSDLAKDQDELRSLRMERDAAQVAYQQLKNSEDKHLELIRKEKEELEARITDLNSLNEKLHDQIESLSLKLTTVNKSQQQHNLSQTAADASANESSAMDISGAGLDTDANDGNNDSLLQIIKFLRKEREIAHAKADILSAEKARLISEQTILQKKVDELESYLKAERTRSDAGTLSAIKHEEVMRKVETLNALNDSNRALREERNSLFEQLKKLNERIQTLENELAPKQDEVAKLNAKLNETIAENTSLRTEAIKWRQRANLLVEKSNKNPEEFKRLLLERENLVKLLTSEKETSSKSSQELQSIRNDHARLQQELLASQRQLQQLMEEKRKLSEELAAQKQNNARIMQEVMDVKNELLQREEACQRSTDENNAKEVQLAEIRNKEATIRKIAKRYKDQYLELKNKVDGGEYGNAGITAAGAAAASTSQQDQMEQPIVAATVGANAEQAEQSRLRNEVDSMTRQIVNLQEENERMRKNSDLYKASLRNVERSDAALREAQARILSITEGKTAVEQELNEIKQRLQHTQSNENPETIRRQYEEVIERMQREFHEQNNAIKEAHARLQRENEQLLIRISQLNRQIGGLHQQSAKPSTSSVATDKTCISESSSSSSSALRTANVKPMSGSSSAQQSATVTPWRGGETPLASIRPISVQNSRTAAVLPTSQQTSGGSVGSGGVAIGGTSSSTSSSSNTTTSSSSSSTTNAVSGAGGASVAPTSATASSNTALVPPQQQVHTTGNSTIESMSSSPTSSHTDYMPSTSTGGSAGSVAVAAIPPMGTASAAESSQEAESVPQRDQQQNESQVLVSGGQQQVVALVSPRVEGAASASPNIQMQQQDPNALQQPSTSGTTSSSTSSHIAAVVSSHSRHTPSSSNVTTTQAGTGHGHKRPRDHDGDSSTSTEDCGGIDKSPSKLPKRLRTPMHSVAVAVADAAVASIMVGETDADVEYQVPTSSQRDQEDEVHSVGDDDEDDEDDDGDDDEDDEEDDDDDEDDEVEADDAMDEADDGGAAVMGAHGEHGEAYEDYEQEPDMDDGCAEVNESNIRCSVEGDDDVDLVEVEDGNEVEIVEEPQQSMAAASTNQAENSAQTAAAVAAAASEQDQQQSRAISSGSSDTAAAAAAAAAATAAGIPSQTVGVAPWKQASSSSQDVGNADDNIPGGSGSAVINIEQHEAAAIDANVTVAADDGKLVNVGAEMPAGEDNDVRGGANAEAAVNAAAAQASGECESHQSGSATQSEIQEIPQSDTDNADGVTSEGEKQAVEEIEEEGREAEASTSHSVNTRSRGTPLTPRSNTARRPARGYARGGNSRQPIVWGQDSSQQQHHHHQQQLQQQQQLAQQHQSVSPVRGVFTPQRQIRGRARSRGRGNLSANYNRAVLKELYMESIGFKETSLRFKKKLAIKTTSIRKPSTPSSALCLSDASGNNLPSEVGPRRLSSRIKARRRLKSTNGDGVAAVLRENSFITKRVYTDRVGSRINLSGKFRSQISEKKTKRLINGNLNAKINGRSSKRGKVTSIGVQTSLKGNPSMRGRCSMRGKKTSPNARSNARGRQKVTSTRGRSSRRANNTKRGRPSLKAGRPRVRGGLKRKRKSSE